MRLPARPALCGGATGRPSGRPSSRRRASSTGRAADPQIDRVLELDSEVEVLLPFPSASWNTTARAAEVNKAAAGTITGARSCRWLRAGGPGGLRATTPRRWCVIIAAEPASRRSRPYPDPQRARLYGVTRCRSASATTLDDYLTSAARPPERRREGRRPALPHRGGHQRRTSPPGCRGEFVDAGRPAFRGRVRPAHVQSGVPAETLRGAISLLEELMRDPRRAEADLDHRVGLLCGRRSALRAGDRWRRHHEPLQVAQRARPRPSTS